MRSMNRRRERGLTLIEILVTLLVISIGLLGVAGLHSFSMRNNYDALMRSHASALISEITDRMRVSRALVYPSGGGASEYNIALSDAAPTVATGSTQAIRDVNAWLTTLAQQLPLGDGRIAVNQATRVVTIEAVPPEVRERTLQVLGEAAAAIHSRVIAGALPFDASDGS